MKLRDQYAQTACTVAIKGIRHDLVSVELSGAAGPLGDLVNWSLEEGTDGSWMLTVFVRSTRHNDRTVQYGRHLLGPGYADKDPETAGAIYSGVFLERLLTSTSVETEGGKLVL